MGSAARRDIGTGRPTNQLLRKVPNVYDDADGRHERIWISLPEQPDANGNKANDGEHSPSERCADPKHAAIHK